MPDPKPFRILVDADACPVKEEVYKVAFRREVAVRVVSSTGCGVGAVGQVVANRPIRIGKKGDAGEEKGPGGHYGNGTNLKPLRFCRRQKLIRGSL